MLERRELRLEEEHEDLLNKRFSRPAGHLSRKKRKIRYNRMKGMVGGGALRSALSLGFRPIPLMKWIFSAQAERNPAEFPKLEVTPAGGAAGAGAFSGAARDHYLPSYRRRSSPSYEA